MQVEEGCCASLRGMKGICASGAATARRAVREAGADPDALTGLAARDDRVPAAAFPTSTVRHESIDAADERARARAVASAKKNLAWEIQ